MSIPSRTPLDVFQKTFWGGILILILFLINVYNTKPSAFENILQSKPSPTKLV